MLKSRESSLELVILSLKLTLDLFAFPVPVFKIMDSPFSKCLPDYIYLAHWHQSPKP